MDGGNVHVYVDTPTTDSVPYWMSFFMALFKLGAQLLSR